MKKVRAQLFAAARQLALICGALLLSVTCSSAAPITIGSFQFQNDEGPFSTGPTFVVFNDSDLFGFAAIFSDVHLRFDVRDLPALDFVLTGDGDGLPGTTVDSNGLVNQSPESALPPLDTVLDAYVTLTLLDQVTRAILPGIVSLGPIDPSLCAGCTNRMTDFTPGSTLAIRFDPADTPVPEPASLLLLGGGIAMFVVKRRWSSR